MDERNKLDGMRIVVGFGEHSRKACSCTKVTCSILSSIPLLSEFNSLHQQFRTDTANSLRSVYPC